MKRFLSVLLILTLVLSLAGITAGAEEVELGAWVKHLGSKLTVTEKKEDGDTVYVMSGIDAAYHTAGIDIMPVLKELIKNKESVTLNFSVEIKADSDEDVTVGMLVRADGVHARISKIAGFKQYYNGKSFTYVSDGTYLSRLLSDAEVYDEWDVLEAEMTFTADDILAGFWSRMVFCFDDITPYEEIESISLKNAKIEVISSVPGTGKPTFDIDALPEEEPIAYVDNATEPLPENNKLIGEWNKGTFGKLTLEKIDVSGSTVLSVKDVSGSFVSPFLDLYPTVKALMEGTDTVSVWVVFDVRAAMMENNLGFGMKIRCNSPADVAADKELFEELYNGGTTFKHSQYGILKTVLENAEYTNEWQRVELLITFTEEDINDKLWSQWNLCFDMMDDYFSIKEIQIKNTGVFLQDDYTPANTNTDNGEGGATDNLSKPVIYRPYGFDKYTATFAEVVPQKDMDNLTNSGSANGGATVTDNSGRSVWFYVGIGAGALAGALIFTGTLIIIKKRGGKEKA